MLLLHATFPTDGAWRSVYTALLHAAEPGIGWRQRRNHCDAILMVSAVDRALAERDAERVKDAKVRQKIMRGLETRTIIQPRKFFWPV